MENALIYFKVALFYLCSMVLFAISNAICKAGNLPELFSLMLATVLTIGLVFVFKRWDKISLSEIGLVFKKSDISPRCRTNPFVWHNNFLKSFNLIKI